MLWSREGNTSLTIELEDTVPTGKSIERFDLRMGDGMQAEIFDNRIRIRGVAREEAESAINLLAEIFN